jgi:hypothetical protein
MAEYQLTATDEPCAVIRHSDSASIPPDPANRDYAIYTEWKEDGGVPDPYVPPEPVPPTPSDEQTVLYNHENRLRAIEGQPPLSIVDFISKMKGGK